MADNSHEISLLKLKVEARHGGPLRTPNDFRALSVAIRQDVGQTLGVTTLKRLWGYVTNINRPTYSTLSILSRYAGYADWNTFCVTCGTESGASGFHPRKTVEAKSVPPGSRLRITWGDSKSCVLERLEPASLFRVIESTNVKLEAGDVVSVPLMVVGEPFVALDCQRNDVRLGTYTSSGHAVIKMIVKE